MGNKMGKAKAAAGGKKGKGRGPAPPAAPASSAGGAQSNVEVSTSLTVDDFELIKVLGRGSFGKVMLTRKKDEGKDGPLYAMKTLRKSELVKKNQLAHTQTERMILENITHPFLVGIKYAFQSADKLYMVLEYMGGGELFHWLKKKRRFTEEGARLYAAEITLAIGCLHNLNIIYRDLKPENILLDMKGHLRITDFGLSKSGITTADGSGGTNTFCGTPEYLAPEIIVDNGAGHGKAVDWWSFGTLLYELMCGLPPFYDANPKRMYQKIAQAPLRFPAALSSESRNILSGLLDRDVQARLGSQGGEEQVKASPFFASLDWDRVYRKEYTPEIVPERLRGGADAETNASNFDAEFTNERAIDSVVDHSALGDAKGPGKFEGFTYQGGGAAEGLTEEGES